jgi:hypothetical protein
LIKGGFLSVIGSHTAADDGGHHAVFGGQGFDLDHHVLIAAVNAKGIKKVLRNVAVARSASGGNRQHDAKNRPTSEVLFRPDTAAMRLDNRIADRQADTHAGLFGRDKRLEQPFANVVGEPGPIVADADLDAVVFQFDGDGNLLGRLPGNGFRRVAQEIEKHLLYLDLVDDNLYGWKIRLEVDDHVLLLDADLGQFDRLGDQRRQSFDPPFAFTAREANAGAG